MNLYIPLDRIVIRVFKIDKGIIGVVWLPAFIIDIVVILEN